MSSYQIYKVFGIKKSIINVFESWLHLNLYEKSSLGDFAGPSEFL